MSLPAPVRLPADPALKPAGSALARWLLALFGWTLHFDGLPARQGVLMVYPHTSNWDFIIGVLAKWGLGLQVRYWGKDSLFRVPLLGRWAGWIGGIPVDRRNAHGVVSETARQARVARERGEFFWLAVAPEGTRSLCTGWRSGAYQVAVQADLPVALVSFDFARRRVGCQYFLRPSGDPAVDFAAFAAAFDGVRGKRPELASPIRLRP